MRVSGTKNIATTFLAVLSCLSTACTTMRPITADTSGEQIRLALRPGDTVHVLTRSGASHSFEVTAVGATSLAGKTVKIMGVGSPEAWGAQIDIPYADIAQIDVRRVQGLKTTGVIAAVVLGAVVGIAAAQASHPNVHISSSAVSR